MPLTIISHRTMSQPVIYAAKAQSWQKLRFPIFNGWLLRGPHGFFFLRVVFTSELSQALI